jgi:hypothetical protein
MVTPGPVRPFVAGVSSRYTVEIKEKAMATTKPVLLFTLVHGTFAKGAPWVTDDSDPKLFRRRLRDALEPQFDVRFDHTFDWGHNSYLRPWDNTLSARRKGATRLIKHLKNAPGGDGARRCLVAHSHGGNIALQALKDDDARKKVDGLICLATPFLFSKRAPFRRDLLGFSAAVLLLATFQWSSRLPLGWAIGLWTYAIIFALMVLLILVFTHRDDSDKIDSHLAEFDGPRMTSAPMPPVWFLRVPEDEVGLLMNFSYRVGKGVRRSWQLVNRIGGALLWGYFLSIYPARFASEKLGLNWAWIDPAVVAFDRIMTPIMILATAILMAMVILRLSFAFDSIRWVPVLDTWSNPVPWEDEKVEFVSLDPGARGLFRHTEIQGPATARIADLVRRQFTDAGANPGVPSSPAAVARLQQ